MSIYHLSLSLARNAGYWIPNYQMEDIIQNLNFAVGIGKQVPIHLLPLPVVSGPTSGKDLAEEFYEWRLQARRWTIGAAEVFHYYCIKFIGGKLDLLSGFTYGFSFILYYGGILCVVGLYQLVVVVATLVDPSCGQEENTLLFTILLVTKYVVVFGTAYFADWLHRKIAGIQEPALQGVTGWIRSIFHFLSTIFVLLMYNLVEAAGIIEMTYRGRDVCGHIPANKASLLGTGTEGSSDAKKKSKSAEIDRSGLTEMANSSLLDQGIPGVHSWHVRLHSSFANVPERLHSSLSNIPERRVRAVSYDTDDISVSSSEDETFHLDSVEASSNGHVKHI